MLSMTKMRIITFIASSCISQAPPPAHAFMITPQAQRPNPSIKRVRNGYLQANRTTTIGQALEHTFSNGQWTTSTSEKGVTFVEFHGTWPFSKFRGSNATELLWCSSNETCSQLEKRIADTCSSESGKAPFVAKYEGTKAELKAEIASLDKEVEAEANTLKPMDDHKVAGKQMALTQELSELPTPETSCNLKGWTDYASVEVPVVVQFSINNDGSFQYQSNNTFSFDELIYRMYD